MDPTRPKLCFLDDNFFACSDWRSLITQVKATGKRFQFKQGLDERLLTDDKIHELMDWPYDGDYIFAFDDIDDSPVIEAKLKRIRELYPTTKKHFKFYVLCGYDRSNTYDDAFWLQDIQDTFERIKILSKYEALPYIMRFEKVYMSPYSGIYTSLAGWCNQPSIFKKFSFKEYCVCKGMGRGYDVYKRDWMSYLQNGGKKGRSWADMENFALEHADIANKYF